MLTSEEIVSAARRSELALAEQVSQWESLSFGVAFWSGAFPNSPEANQLRDVWLADSDPLAVYQQAHDFFVSRGVTCGKWSPAAGQAVDPVATLLIAKGWKQQELGAWALSRWDWVDVAPMPGTRVLPARAMPRAFRDTYENNSPSADLAAERLNDSRQDIFVAMLEGKPAGRIGYLQVGDFASLTDLFVLPPARGRGVARAMVAHVLGLARRLLPRAFVATLPSAETTGTTFLERCGFAQCGSLAQFIRNE